MFSGRLKFFIGRISGRKGGRKGGKEVSCTTSGSMNSYGQGHSECKPLTVQTRFISWGESNGGSSTPPSPVKNNVFPTPACPSSSCMNNARALQFLIHQYRSSNTRWLALLGQSQHAAAAHVTHWLTAVLCVFLHKHTQED